MEEKLTEWQRDVIKKIEKAKKEGGLLIMEWPRNYGKSVVMKVLMEMREKGY